LVCVDDVVVVVFVVVGIFGRINITSQVEFVFDRSIDGDGDVVIND
jgi:hypothetical protein